MAPSPFDDFIIKLYSQLEPKPGRLFLNGDDAIALSFLLNQLHLLRAAYVGMIEIDYYKNFVKGLKESTTPVSNREEILDRSTRDKKVFLGYYNFINILCQLDRNLKKYFPEPNHIPLFENIRFYRNKVAEHWDDYTDNIYRGVVFYKDKLPVPLVEGESDQRKRGQLLEELKLSFDKLGSPLEIGDNTNNLIGLDNAYRDVIFLALRKIKNWQNRRSGEDENYDNMISLLIMFGFPMPILDLEEYSKELVSYSSELLRDINLLDQEGEVS